MQILAHRGLWKKEIEKNSLDALIKSLDHGFGLETDIRDLNGRLVISHDLPTEDSAVYLDQLLDYYAKNKCQTTLGLNIKSDGLQDKLRLELKNHNITKYFVFDMSIPDTIGYLKSSMPVFIRRSEFEYHPQLVKLAQGVWLDELLGDWIKTDMLLNLVSESKTICIVSPELHGRSYLSQWHEIKNALKLGCPTSQLLICTDFPIEFERFLSEHN